MKKQILIAGDSTVTNRVSTVQSESDCCYTGWGQMLPLYLGTDYKVRNFAQSGLTTDTFKQGGHYDLLLSYLNAEDYVLFQFGHNDQKVPELRCDVRYKENLITYINEIRERKAIPIIVTPLARNSWCCKSGKYNDLLLEYAEIAKEVCKETNTHLIDLHKSSKNWIVSEGREKVKHYFHPGDFTHSNDHGAFKFAGFVHEELKTIIAPSINPLAWSDLCPSKVPMFLYEDVDKTLTREEALRTVREFCSFFAKNEKNISNDNPEIIAARQNDYLLFEDKLDEFITEKDFLELVTLGLSGREIVPKDLFPKDKEYKCTITRKIALNYIDIFEDALNYKKDKVAPEIAGS